jgi:hypothetical protein
LKADDGRDSVYPVRFATGAGDDGWRSQGQRQLFQEFHLDGAVVDAVLDLPWVRAELAPHYSRIGRPSIDPVLMIRMLIVGYMFAIRLQLCREVQVNLARRWFCDSDLNIQSPITPHSHVRVTSAFATATSSAASSSASWGPASRPAWSVANASRSIQACPNVCPSSTKRPTSYARTSPIRSPAC